MSIKELLRLMPWRNAYNLSKKVTERDGCWIYSGPLGHNGYGKIQIGYRSLRAHRYVWELVNGEIPKNRELCHTCAVRNCINPEHLYVGTHWQNMHGAIFTKQRRRDDLGRFVWR